MLFDECRWCRRAAAGACICCLGFGVTFEFSEAKDVPVCAGAVVRPNDLNPPNCGDNWPDRPGQVTLTTASTGSGTATVDSRPVVFMSVAGEDAAEQFSVQFRASAAPGGAALPSTKMIDNRTSRFGVFQGKPYQLE